MVSIKTIATLGVIAAAAGVFLAAGGASGIGRSIGSSISGGLTSFGSAFTSALSTGGGNVNAQTAGKTISGSGAATVDGVNTVQDKIVQEGGIPSEVLGSADSPLALAFKEDLTLGNISQAFATKFSFLSEPTSSNVLDVSKTFSFISERDGIASFDPSKGSFKQVSGLAFGGFGSAESQRAALTAAIQRSSSENPQFFG